MERKSGAAGYSIEDYGSRQSDNSNEASGAKWSGHALPSSYVIWDHCLEREAYIRRSLTAHDIYETYRLNGQVLVLVPEAVVSGDTANISQFALFGWFEWVMFRDTAMTYPDD